MSKNKQQWKSYRVSMEVELAKVYWKNINTIKPINFNDIKKSFEEITQSWVKPFIFYLPVKSQLSIFIEDLKRYTYYNK